MSSSGNRGGHPVEPTVINAGTANSQTDPRIVTFKDARGDVLYARPCIVTNHCTNAAIKVKVNKTTTNDFDNDSDDDGLGYFIIAAGADKDVSLGGILNVTSVSLITQHASDDPAIVSVVGWVP